MLERVLGECKIKDVLHTRVEKSDNSAVLVDKVASEEWDQQFEGLNCAVGWGLLTARHPTRKKLSRAERRCGPIKLVHPHVGAAALSAVFAPAKIPYLNAPEPGILKWK